jgi:ectoine hydroxylase-related dioxygenase (phytanoyl-CoA dioxygenase family)
MERGEGGRSQSVHVLLSCPTLDVGIMHPVVLPLVTELVGEDIVCEEHSVMFRAPIDEEPPATNWHRDVRNEPTHPLGIHGLSVVYYLTNVDESTHCFSIVPETAAVKRSGELPACDGVAGRDLFGAAGTAVLFNGGSCHAGRLRRTAQERRTVHIYYGHADQPALSEHTIFPRRLLDHPDADKRRLFRRPNQITRAVHNLDGS